MIRSKKQKLSKTEEKKLLERWDTYVRALREASSVDPDETPEARVARRTHLEAKPEEWLRYYFPTYYRAEAAPFQVAATKRLLEHDHWMEVRAWSRELAKSTRSMMEIAYLALTGEIHNVLLVSYSEDHATRLLAPLRLTLEYSPRITADYGEQRGPTGIWTDSQFITTGKVAFLALGAGQSPRGQRNEAFRPDFLLIDDIDTDEEVRNPARVQAKWEWIQRALLPTLSVAGKHRILFNGNVIARDCIITRAAERADYFDKVNIRDDKGRSTWPAKNSEEDIDRFFRMLSTSAIQGEYYNNPVTEGEVFREMTRGECPPLESLRFAIVYGDPSPSNKRSSKGASYKAVVLLGSDGSRYYVYKCFLEQTTNDTFLDWYFAMRDYVRDRCPVYYMIENNSLQDPFWEQVLQPLLMRKAKDRGVMPIVPDTRAKMDKFARIEATLEPLVRESRLILNIRESEDPHMRRLEEQFLMVAPSLPAPADGPDAVEGALYALRARLASFAFDAVYIAPGRHTHKY